MNAATLPSLIILLPLTAASLRAQYPPDIDPGTRIRFAHRLGPTRIVDGICQGIRHDTVRIMTEPTGEIVPIPVRSLGRLEVYRGKRSNTLVGAVLGAVGGGLVLGAAAAATFEEPEPCSDWLCFDFGPQDAGEAFTWGFAGGAVLGAVVGSVVGALTKSDRWERVALSSLVVVPRVEPATRFGIAASVAF